MKISTLKNRLIVLAAFAMASVAFAQDTSSVYIRNACDSISTMIEFVPAYIEESNWYGNPQTWTKDSTNFKFHETYKTVNVSSSNFKDSLPLSIQAKCLETPNTTYKYAVWNSSKEWVEDESDEFTTVIYDIHNLKMNGHDSTNTNNILAFVPGDIPATFPSSHLLFSETFEFAFEWWYASASYTHRYKNPEDDSLTIRMRTRYGSSVSNDSLKAVNSAINALSIPDTMKSVRIQVLKVVLIDSRKPLSSSSSEPSSSSSSNPVSCSAEQSSSSSSDGKSSSSEEKSSSSEAESSSSVSSSSSANPVSCSAEVSSSSEASSSSEGKSSSSEAESSSSEASSSSSAEPVSCSAEVSSSSDAESSSSEGPVRIFALEGPDASKHVVQVRRLDGSIVKSSEKLGPGVYYVKYSTGVWQKKSVLSK